MNESLGLHSYFQHMIGYRFENRTGRMGTKLEPEVLQSQLLIATRKCQNNSLTVSIFLVSYVEERPWWPKSISGSLDKGRQKKAKGSEEREIRSSLFSLDLKRWQVQSN